MEQNGFNLMRLMFESFSKFCWKSEAFFLPASNDRWMCRFWKKDVSQSYINGFAKLEARWNFHLKSNILQQNSDKINKSFWKWFWDRNQLLNALHWSHKKMKQTSVKRELKDSRIWTFVSSYLLNESFERIQNLKVTNTNNTNESTPKV